MLRLQSCITLLMLLLLGGCTSRQAAISPPPPAAAAEVQAQAISLIGTPYRWGGNTPQSGFDCSGLIVYVYRNAVGMQLPRTTGEMLGMRVPAPAVAQLQGGDLLFFDTADQGKVSHAGIYVGEGRFVHAPRSGGTVRLERLNTGYWSSRYLAARRPLVTAGQR